MNHSKDIERRRNRRFPVDARCWIERESVTLLGTVTNISIGGLFIRTPVTIALGSQVDLNVTLPTGLLAASGHVVWTAAPDLTSGCLGLGIRFDKVLSGKRRLDHIVSDDH
ncbi:MAG: PilZ domain-containing protein [Myxococcota bacterium]|nr:PilZ domain-containing protein [Myxococcota bacterium]